MEVVRSGCRLKKTGGEVVQKDCPAPQLCKKDAVDQRIWRKLIKYVV